MFIKLYDIIVAFFSVILDIFFREVKSRGSHKIPKEGPVIFVAAPHANQFVDPLVLMRHCQRQVSFLIAEKSMKRRYIGSIAKAINANHQVNKTVEDGCRVLFLLIYRIIVLTIWIILGLPGFILNLPLIIIARVISAKKAKEAVESSSVKVAGRDVLATWKLLVALVVTPSLRPLFLSLIPSTKSYFQTLREVREQLSYDLTELINELGPKIYPDFDNSRLVREVKGKSRSGSASPSPSRPSSTGLQFSSFLTISDWLSEKNLDWERADDSDYDDVFFFLDQQNGKITGRSRSNSRTRIKDQGSRSRSSSIGSNNDGGLGSNGNTIGIEPLSTVDQSPEIERNRSDLSLPKFTFKDCDEDSGYHGDKEYDDKIETKKEV
ncbi:326_t:CDS:2 [Entrophospora sp. SA101]|nr:326_t:CDS:2 [Entrophospora sp. SA101]